MFKMIKGTCPSCGKETCVYVDKYGYDLWLSGVPMEEALPELSDTTKELLLTGVCGFCQGN